MVEKKKTKMAKKVSNKAADANKPVTKTMLIGDIIQKYPDSARIMMQNGLHCIGCHVSVYETLEQGAGVHGIDVNKLVDEINKAISRKG